MLCFFYAEALNCADTERMLNENYEGIFGYDALLSPATWLLGSDKGVLQLDC